MPVVGLASRIPAPLPVARDAYIAPEALAPWVARYAEQYGADPEVMGAIVEQESSYVNHAVHRDGTGHGLIGLDDHGLLPDFERWSGLSVGRGRNARTIPPEKQIEFLAKTLGALTEKYGGDSWEAARTWHAGAGGRDKPDGRLYEKLVRARLPNVATWLTPGEAGGPAFAATGFDPPRATADPLRLDPGGGTPVAGGGFDIGNT